MPKNKGIKELISESIFALFEDKAGDLRKKYPQHSAEITQLVQADPSHKQKYLEYAVKVLDSHQALVPEIIDVINLFHRYSNKLDKKDINQWNFTELRDKLFDLMNSGDALSKKEKSELVSQGAEKIYEDEICFVYHIDTKAASCKYGKGTKWCITMADHDYFNSYRSGNVVFYFVLSKELPADNQFHKIALAFQRDLEGKELRIDFFNALDQRFEERDFTRGGKDHELSDFGVESRKKILVACRKDALKRPINIEFKIKQAKNASDFTPEEMRRAIVPLCSSGRKEVLVQIRKDIPELQKIVQHSGVAKAITNFAEYVSQDVGPLQAAVAATGDPSQILSFARRVKDADVKFLQAAIEKTKDTSHILQFVLEVPGAEFEAAQRVVLAEKDPVACTDFAEHVKGADVKALQQIVVTSGEAWSALDFATRVKGADLKLLRKVIQDHGDKDIIDAWSEFVHGGDMGDINAELPKDEKLPGPTAESKRLMVPDDSDISKKNPRSTYGAAQPNLTGQMRGGAGVTAGARGIGTKPGFPVPPEQADNVHPELQEEKEHSGLFFGFLVPPEAASILGYLTDESAAEEPLHVTLFYQKGIRPELCQKAASIVKEMVDRHGPIPVKIAGLGRFSASHTSDGKDVIYASVDSPQLTDFRGLMVAYFKMAGIEIEQEHGFTPHVTLQYVSSAARPLLPHLDPIETELSELIMNGVSDLEEKRGPDNQIDLQAAPAAREPAADNIERQLGEDREDSDQKRDDVYDFTSGTLPKKKIPHIEDLDEGQYKRFLLALYMGRARITEKVDGACRIEFGRERHNGSWATWTRSKNGQKVYDPKQHTYTPLREAHQALLWVKDGIPAHAVADVLYGEIPNTIPYDGKNRIVVHSPSPIAWALQHSDIPLWEICSIPEFPEETFMSVIGQALAEGSERDRQKMKDALLSKLNTLTSNFSLGGMVEGVVVQHLGESVKIVDRELFTKLNQFYWYYRESLDHGTGTKGNWRNGILRELRHSLADSVGARRAKGPRFVEHLVQLGRDAPSVQDLLRMYVEHAADRSVLPPDLTIKVMRSIREAIARFNTLQSEWKLHRDSCYSIVIRGRTYGWPEAIRKRTDEAFAATAAELGRIAGTLDHISSMDPVSRRAAILEQALTPGQRERLTVEVRKNQITAVVRSLVQESPQTSSQWLGGGTKKADAGTQKMAADKFTSPPEGVDSASAKEILRTNAEKIKKQRKFDIPPEPKVLGTGTKGTAFDIGRGLVAKVTNDKKEALASQRLKDLGAGEYVCQIYDVFKIAHTEIYVIIQERLYPLSGSTTTAQARGGKENTLPKAPTGGDAEELNNAIVITKIKDSLSATGYDWNAAYEASQEAINQIANRIPDDERSEAYREGALEALRILVDKFHIDKMAHELLSHGIKFYDYHQGNVMKRANGQYVVIDIGYSAIDKGKQPDVLERLTKEITSLVTEAGTIPDTLGVTIGRFQPFTRAHGLLIRTLAQRFTKVIVLVAGNGGDKKKNPFSYETRAEMMEKSLPDVWSKVELHRAEFKGKPSGYVPGIVSDIAKSGNSSIKGDLAVTVLVGPDRKKDMELQIKHARENKEKEKFYIDPDQMILQIMPRVQAPGGGEVSGTQVRAAIQKGDEETVKQMVDAHLVSNESDFESVYAKLRKELGAEQGGPLKEDESSSAPTTNKGDRRGAAPSPGGDNKKKYGLSTVGGEEGLEQFIQSKAELIQQKKGIDVTKMKSLGNGTFGVAYDIGGNKVLKVTTDITEARAGLAAKGKNKEHIVRVYDVWQFGRKPDEQINGKTIYCLVLEKLQKLSNKEADDLDDSFRILWVKAVSPLLGSWDVNKIMQGVHDFLKKKVDDTWNIDQEETGPATNQTPTGRRNVAPQDADKRKQQGAKKELSQRYEKVRQAMEKFQMPEILADLRAVGVQYFDFHAGNIMKRGSNYVVTDLGGESISDGPEPAVLEKIVHAVEILVEDPGNTGGGQMTGTPGAAQTGLRAQSSSWSSPSGMQDPDDEDDDGDAWRRELAMADDKMQRMTHGIAQTVTQESLEKLWIPWSKSNARPYESKTKGVGNGEWKVACESRFLGKVQGGSVSFDILGEDGSRWEVKELKKYTNEIRVNVGGAADVLKFMTEASHALDLLERFLECLTQKDMRALCEAKISLPKIVEFTARAKESVSKGEVSKGLVLGRTAKNPLGLKQVAEELHSYMERTKLRKQYLRELDWRVTTEDLVFISESLGLPMRGDPTSLEVARSHLRHRFLTDPLFLTQTWRNVSRASRVFEQCDGVVLVNEEKGYLPVMRKDLDRYFGFERISTRAARFRIRIRA
jgi:cytidyltransferase-like protein